MATLRAKPTAKPRTTVRHNGEQLKRRVMGLQPGQYVFVVTRHQDRITWKVMKLHEHQKEGG